MLNKNSLHNSICNWYNYN